MVEARTGALRLVCFELRGQELALPIGEVREALPIQPITRVVLTPPCLAGVFSLDDALRLVAARGRLMQAMPAGRMLSVASTAAALSPLCAAAGVDIACINAPDSVVVAGTLEAIAAFGQQLGRLLAAAVEGAIAARREPARVELRP